MMAKQRFTIVFQEIHKLITEDVWAKDIEQADEMAEAMIPAITAKYYLNKDFTRVAEIRVCARRLNDERINAPATR